MDFYAFRLNNFFSIFNLKKFKRCMFSKCLNTEYLLNIWKEQVKTSLKSIQQSSHKSRWKFP